MKRILLNSFSTFCISIFLLLTSCNQVVFTSPQPRSGKSVTSFNSTETGTYSSVNLPDIKIEIDNISIENQTFKLSKKAESDTLIEVRKYENCYFFNYQIDGNYAVIVGYFFENKLALYMLSSDDRSIKYLNELTPVKSINKEKLLYQIHPLGNEFAQIFESEMFALIAIYHKK